ncbi:Duf1p NDAI_0B02760 [Naumovozyma dairenensis CBS 421]|uniref:Uncharacterized protein n=1 Tax=Naumovozyma dairenensis (strain ATCC 10597 / BCRC 20456 / CBS 421 / NBRC 0211 / NRRL Y-12639) TaxID=1071378 RepID=G0W6A0_NAUDC|nr:hypothetical protein NDAI_0B02760 [Naumovozyma dairenensis CBS 421]CCD23311.1 hypothetical protein NDAI_0B02760 [Naumovozyma dairenensis CBS 421]
MKQLTVSYGLISPQTDTEHKNSHILPISKIYTCPDLNLFLTGGRDGSIIINANDKEQGKTKKRLQVHSDWVTDLVRIPGTTKFISVSHDFSIVLFEIFYNGDPDSWNMKIVGSHDDYIKCIVPLLSMSNDDSEFWFATAGLDKKIKIWKLFGFEFSEISLIHVFDNANTQDDTGSIYTMVSVQNDTSNLPFDLVVGDADGNIVLYSCQDKIEVKRLKHVHSTNIKVIKLLENSTKLLTTASDGIINLWDLVPSVRNVNAENVYKPTRIGSWKWDCSIWCIEGSSLYDIVIGDSMGRISKLDFDLIQNDDILNVYHKEVKFTSYFNPGQYKRSDTNGKTITKNIESNGEQSSTDQKKKKKVHGGVLDMKFIDQDTLLFSFCDDSNLNSLNLRVNKLTINKGGFALTRSSLLTNRRHVITENTKGEVQRWDIVSCELLNTFPSNEGSFDDIVIRFTSKEILSHWCTVSVKVGVLFVKINEKFLSTEIYGSALEKYEIINDIEINAEQRYNLGKIVINSLFNEFLNYEAQKDEIVRKRILTKKKSIHHHQKDTAKNSKNSIGKHRNNVFSKLNSSASNLADSYDSSFASVPGTPLVRNLENKGMDISISNTDQFLLKPPGSAPPLTTNPLESVDPLDIVQPSPMDRSASSSHYNMLSRRFKSFRENNSKQNLIGVNTPEENMSDIDGGFVTSENSKDVSTEPLLWNQESSTENGVDKNVSNFALGPINTNLEKLRNEESSRMNSISSINSPMMSSIAVTNAGKKEDFMSDLLDEIHNAYIQEYNNSNSSSLKILSKKSLESKIEKDLTCPLIQVKSGSLILVHCWNDGSCGGRVLFSTYLPPSRSPHKHKIGEGNSSTNYDDDRANDSKDHSSDLGDSALVDSSRVFKDDVLLEEDEFEHDEYGTGIRKRQIFEQFERNLPYWFAKTLFKNVKIVEIEQPKVNFIIAPWVGNREEALNGTSTDSKGNSNDTQFHYRLKFGKSKEQTLASTDLPKVSDANAKLIAPGMIKVKKIKLYVIDRFDGKTPEMKAKQDPSIWLELLCRDQVLDNDMTLSTVRTLYWKSQGEIIINFRRKPNTI